MQLEPQGVSWLDEHAAYSLRELAECSRLSETELLELVEYGAIAPLEPHPTNPTFAGLTIYVARTAARLRNDFEIDLRGVAVALALLERVRVLEATLHDLRVRTPR